MPRAATSLLLRRYRSAAWSCPCGSWLPHSRGSRAAAPVSRCSHPPVPTWHPGIRRSAPHADSFGAGSAAGRCLVRAVAGRGLAAGAASLSITAGNDVTAAVSSILFTGPATGGCNAFEAAAEVAGVAAGFFTAFAGSARAAAAGTRESVLGSAANAGAGVRAPAACDATLFGPGCGTGALVGAGVTATGASDLAGAGGSAAAMGAGGAEGTLLVAIGSTAGDSNLAPCMVHHHAPVPATSAIAITPRPIHKPRRARSSGSGRTARASAPDSALAWRFSRSLRTWLIRLIASEARHRPPRPRVSESGSTTRSDAQDAQRECPAPPP